MMKRIFKNWSQTTLFSASQKPTHGKQPTPSLLRIISGGVGAFIGIGTLAFLVEAVPELELLVIGSFGASAVLLYGAPKAPFSQPRNLLGGHLLSAIVGLLCFKYLPDLNGLQEASAVSLAIMLMLLTKTMHPPGDATALIAVIGSDYLHTLGWGYVFLVMMGAGVMLMIAMVVNNLANPGSYPQRWD